MKKLLLLVGVGVGYVLGSRVGRGPYEELESRVRGFFAHQDANSQPEREGTNVQVVLE